jgi:hypothetical protein
MCVCVEARVILQIALCRIVDAPAAHFVDWSCTRHAERPLPGTAYSSHLALLITVPNITYNKPSSSTYQTSHSTTLMFDSFLDADFFAATPNDPTSSSAIWKTLNQGFVPSYPHAPTALRPASTSPQHRTLAAAGSVPTAWHGCEHSMQHHAPHSAHQHRGLGCHRKKVNQARKTRQGNCSSSVMLRGMGCSRRASSRSATSLSIMPRTCT